MVNRKLLECPFCGGLPVLVPVVNDRKLNGYIVMCGRCKCSTSVEDKEADAVEVWNNRAPNEREITLERLLAGLVNSFHEEIHAAGMRTRAIHQAEDFLKSNAD